jgi:glucan phosphorylase
MSQQKRRLVVASKNFAENITKVLYPNDDEIRGKELRLQQQYFFVSCALQDMVRIHLRGGHTLVSKARPHGKPGQAGAPFAFPGLNWFGAPRG